MKDQLAKAQQYAAEIDAWIAERLSQTPVVQRAAEQLWMIPRVTAVRDALKHAAEFVEAAEKAVTDAPQVPRARKR